MKKITIIDYNMGNTFNVCKAFETMGCDVTLSKDHKIIQNSDRLVLPGVGSFENGMDNLKKIGLDDTIKQFIKKNRPFLGICVGMQLMMTKSYENGIHKGLDLIEGEVIKFKKSKTLNQKYKIPQIGWNKLIIDNNFIKKSNSKDNFIFKDIINEQYMYFLHSYYVVPKNKKVIIAKTSYGIHIFCSILNFENLYGFQFHPERSGEHGLTLLKNFINI